MRILYQLAYAPHVGQASADILGVSQRTVNKHLEHIFEKLGVETRTAAAIASSLLQEG